MNKLFMLWFVSFLGILGSLYLNFETKFLQDVWVADFTKFSFLILGIYLVSYGFLGAKLYKNSIKKKDDLDVFFEIAGWMTTIGVMGTVIGIIGMTSGFESVNFSDLENVKDLFKLLASGMSTALYTTGAGIGCHLGLRIPLILVETRIKES